MGGGRGDGGAGDGEEGASSQVDVPDPDTANNTKEKATKRQVMEECNLLIQEFLQRNQLVKTCKEFQKECSELQLPLPKIISGKLHGRFF